MPARILELVMATQIKPPARGLHDEDFYLWARRQAELLRLGRFEDLDLEHLIEEVDDLAASLERSVRSRARTIMEHLLKLQHSPAPEPRLSWRETIRTQRSELLNDLTPSLRRHLVERFADVYARARHDAEASLRDQGEHAAADALPADCPYTLDQLTADWLP